MPSAEMQCLRWKEDPLATLDTPELGSCKAGGVRESGLQQGGEESMEPTARTADFPKMAEVRQQYPASPPLNFPVLLKRQFAETNALAGITPGMKIAVGVGSRGIANLREIVHVVLEALRSAGASPFIVPAMGSHGGATPEGQENVLAEYGITRETMGVPIASSMDVVSIGKTAGGLDIPFSAAALEASGIVVVNRIKPHTDFRGNLGSGLQKMLAIGLGKHAGASSAHREASRFGHEAVIRERAKAILAAAPVLCGVAILEDQNHQTADVRVVAAERIREEEDGLFARACALMPRLPLEEIDLLIVDRIGKEISGTGMDTNVIGRDILEYSTSLRDGSSIKPHIFRIFVRELTEATKGNGIGIGLADFTTSRAVRALDLRYTYVNAITSLGLLPAKIPIYFESDREVLENAISSLAAASPATLRIVRIADTLNLSRLLVSEAGLKFLDGQAGLTITGAPRSMEFDREGNLYPLPA